MIIFISMILWVALMRLLLSSEMKYAHIPGGGHIYKVSHFAAILTMSYIVFWIGMRSGMADTRAYIYGFEIASQDISTIPSLIVSNVKGQAWAAGTVLFKGLISTDYHYWLMSLAMIMGFSVMACYKRYSEAFFFSILLFILDGNFSWMFNGMRQFLCVTMLMLAFRWLLQGKTWQYLLLVSLLGYVHITVLLMIPLYFIVRQKPWSRMIMLTIAATLLAITFIAPLAGAVEDTLSATSESYKGSTVFLEEDDGVHPLRVLIAFVPVVLAWFSRKRIAAENNNLLNIGINMCLMTALLYSVGMVTSGILIGRLPIYCEVYMPITLAMLINRFHKNSSRTILYGGCVAGYLAFFFLILGKQYYISNLTGLIK